MSGAASATDGSGGIDAHNHGTAPRSARVSCDTLVFNPALLERELRDDPANALREMADAIERGQASLRMRGTLQGVGSSDPAQEHYLLSLDLSVPTVQQNFAPATDAMRALLQGRNACRGVRR